MRYDTDTLEQIQNNIDIVDYAGQYLELKEENGEYWSLCPFHKGDTDPSLSFNRDKGVFCCLGCHTSGGIITFAMEYHKLSFPDAVEHLLHFGNIEVKDREYSELFNVLKRFSKNKASETIIDRPYLANDVMKKYSKEPIQEWISEGILPDIMDKYDVRYDRQNNRIVFPVRDLNGNIIAIKGRTLIENFKELHITKYQYYNKIFELDFLFGLNYNIDEIKRRNEIIIPEGAKSVMLAEGYGYGNCASVETNTISQQQLEIILKLRCDVVIALDKGMKIVTKKTKNDDKYVYVNIGMLPKLTNVYVVEDKFNALPPKASPFDLGKDVWDKLYNERTRIM